MKKYRLRLALLGLSALVATPAFAADYGAPPEMRSTSYDISVGVFGEARAADSWYNNGCDCERDISGIGYGAGIQAAFDYVSDGWFVGLVGDWSFGGEMASNNDPDQPAEFNMPSLGTLRARMGLTNGDASIFVSGGAATALTELGATIDVGGEIQKDDDSQWTFGWALGTGLSYDLTETVSVDLEYLFIHLDGVDYDLGSGEDTKGNAFQSFDATQTVRMGVNYRFSM